MSQHECLSVYFSCESEFFLTVLKNILCRCSIFILSSHRKTSLLNALSGRSVYESGTISINGEVLQSQSGMKRLMSKIAYVKQADIFFQHLTVRDQFTYTALLRLPSSMTTERKVAEVDRIIALLRLNKVENSPIKMLSGGEAKRVNIGTELLTGMFSCSYY